MANVRPQQLDISTGSTDNDTVTTKGYVDEHAGLGAAKKEILTVSTPGQTAFTLSEEPNSAESLGLFLNGQLRTVTTEYTRSGVNITWLDPDGLTLETTDELKAWYDFTAPAYVSPWQRSAGVVSLDVSTDEVQVSTTGGLQFGAGTNVVGISTDSGQSSESSTLLLTELAAKTFAKEKSLTQAIDPLINSSHLNVTGAGTEYTVVWQIALRQVGSSYNYSTGKFTAATNGFYEWKGSLVLEGITVLMTKLEIFLNRDTGGGPQGYPIWKCDPTNIKDISGHLTIPFAWGGVLDSDDEMWISIKISGDVVDAADVMLLSRSFIIYHGNYTTS